MCKVVMLAGALVSCLLVVPSAKAGGMVLSDGLITSVTNTSGNGSHFSVGISGGAGVCAGRTLRFSQSSAGNEEVFKRAYAAALTAISAGLLVDVYSYKSLTCTSPSWIRIKD
jgi:hypothetical protein